jgi:hypothetical protein
MRLLSVFFAGALISPVYLQAQQASSPIIDGVEETGEMSPLFWDRINLQRTRESDEQLGQSWNEISRRPPAIQPMPDSFQKLFHTIVQRAAGKPQRVVPERKIALSVILEPAQFDLKERREITVTLTLTNGSDRQIRITFPTSQRIELLLKDKTGKVIERWSHDRSFAPLEEVVAVNPHESIAYSQRLPTREMRRLETYTLEASLFNNPQYTQNIFIRPQ